MFLAIRASQKLIFNSFNILDCWNSWRCISIDLFLLIPLEISVVGSIFLSLLLVLICKFICASFLRFLNSSCQLTVFLSRALSSLVSFFQLRIYDSSVDFNLSYLSCFFCIFQIHLLLYRWHFIYYSCICRKSWVVCLISRCSISSITWWIYSTPRTAAWFYIRISSTIASDICFPLTWFQFFIFFLLVWTSLSRSFWRLT